VLLDDQIEDGGQHEHTAHHGVDEELHRRVDAPGASPDADEEVHGDEHRFPEDIEEEKIGGDEDADHAAPEDEQEEMVGLDPLGDRRPAARMARGMSRVVSRTMSRLIPSTPTA